MSTTRVTRSQARASSRDRAAAPAPAAPSRASRASSRRREVVQESSSEDEDSDESEPLFDYFPEDVADWRKNFRYLLNLTKTLFYLTQFYKPGLIY